MYDSLTSNVARLLRRRWYLVAAALVLGAIAGFALTATSGSDVSGRLDVRFAPPYDLVAIADSDRAIDVDVATVASQSTVDYDADIDNVEFTATFVPNAAARSIRVTVVGGTNDAVARELDVVVDDVSTLVLQPRLTQIDLAVGATDEQIAALQDRSDALADSIAALPLDDLVRPTLLAQQTQVDSDLTDARISRSNLVVYRSYVADDLISQGDTVFTTVSPGITSVIIGVFLGGMFVLAVAFVVVLVDRRLRRRMQIERSAPSAEVVAVAPGRAVMGAPDREAFVLSVNAFVERHGLVRLVVAGLSDGVSDVEDLLGDVAAADVVFAEELAPLAGERDVDGTGYLIIVGWGRSTDLQLAAAVASLHSIGDAPIAVAMLGVPRRDLDWAGVGAGSDVGEIV